MADGKCSLKPELIAEIQSYQSVVDKIAHEAVNGSFAGNTWERFVCCVDFKTKLNSGMQQ